MTHEEFAGRLRMETDGVHADQLLRQRALRAAKGKERTMKKKISLAVAFALLAVTVCAVAIAAANRWGMLDFVSRYSTEPYIPEDAQDYVEQDVALLQNDLVSVNVRELYYDGRTSRMTVDVTPKDEHVLLVGEDVCLEDPFCNLTQSYVDGGENDMRSVYQVFCEEGYEDIYTANVSMMTDVSNPAAGMASGMLDYKLGEDGTLTLFSQTEYTSDMPERSAIIRVTLTPYDKPVTADSVSNYKARVKLDYPMTLVSAVNPTDAPVPEDAVANTYVSEAPVEYPSVGVRVDRLLIEVKPQELYATVDFTVTDREAFDKLEDGLWFEFIDPQKEINPALEGEFWQQRLTPGLSGGGMVQPMEETEQPTHFRQTETLGKNELHETYTLRAYDCWEKNRYEAQELVMRPAKEGELTATPN